MCLLSKIRCQVSTMLRREKQHPSLTTIIDGNLHIESAWYAAFSFELRKSDSMRLHSWWFCYPQITCKIHSKKCVCVYLCTYINIYITPYHTILIHCFFQTKTFHNVTASSPNHAPRRSIRFIYIFINQSPANQTKARLPGSPTWQLKMKS